MSTIVQVNLGERSYPIHIGTGLLSKIGMYCREQNLGNHCLIVSDNHVAPLYAAEAEASLLDAGFTVASVTVPSGEKSKSHEQLCAIYDAALSIPLDRKAFILALGGGVVGDLGGFAAASYLRGIDLIQLPTSLLAMVDSSVGGKTGINVKQGKNLIGAFHQPQLVLADLDVLQSLSAAELSAGMAEVIKYGVIYDAELFSYIESHAEALKNLDVEALLHVVKRSCEIKAEVVHQDEKEEGLRSILNYGHTLGHAIENAANYGSFLHGEAISIGMIYASVLSEKCTGLSAEATVRQKTLLKAFNLPTELPELDWIKLRAAMAVDKKSVGAAPRFVLASEIGKVSFGNEVSEAMLKDTWDELQAS